jgi:hypothetical protein
MKDDKHRVKCEHAKRNHQHRAICLLNVEQHIDKQPKHQYVHHCVDEEELASLPLYALEVPQDGKAPDAPIAEGEQELPN